MTVADEHRFTAWCDLMLAQLERPQLPQEPLELLIVNAPGNRHVLGPRIAELALLEAGIRTEAILPDLPIDEIVKLARDRRPAWIGISCALPDQILASRTVIEQLGDSGFTGGIIIAGYALRATTASWNVPDAHFCYTIEQVHGLIRSG